MIGTNKDNTEAEILEGVTAIVNQTRTRQPDTKILLLGIFRAVMSSAPSAEKFCRTTRRSRGSTTALTSSISTSARS
jgi:hypothetical protein